MSGFLGSVVQCGIIIWNEQERRSIMLDDYKYSIGRTVVYRHREPSYADRRYGQYGPDQTVGLVRGVELGKSPEHIWLYLIENLRTGETAKVAESDIFRAILGRSEKSEGRRPAIDPERIAQVLSESASRSPLSGYLSATVGDLLRREETEEMMKHEGRDLPLVAGDYIRIRGDLRSEMESSHNHYAKIVEVEEPDIVAIESRVGNYFVRHRYRVLLDDGIECVIYDPEIKFYYTAEGRSVVLNWRAATFLAEAFGDDPPYLLDYSFLEDHVFSRDYLEALSPDKLGNLYATLLYVKGKMGLRDFETADKHLDGVPKEFLVDSVLVMSRFDMRKNRNLTAAEIEGKRKDDDRLRRLLHGH